MSWPFDFEDLPFSPEGSREGMDNCSSLPAPQVELPLLMGLNLAPTMEVDKEVLEDESLERG